MRNALILLFSTLFLQTAFAQSTITLDDFSLDKSSKSGSGKPATSGKHPSVMEKCILDQANCDNREFKTKRAISLDDVVNLGIIDREEAQKISSKQKTQTTQALPSIDLEILFDYDSSKLRDDQRTKLNELASILGGKKFSNYRFAFLGHSDAKGRRTYNQELSQARAQTVSQFVLRSAGIKFNRVTTKGLGSRSLKNPTDPFGAENRRVQLVVLPVAD